MTTRDAELAPVGSLRTFAGNPRRGDVSALRASLEAHGQYRPLVVNERTREVLAGNHTFLAARELGWPEVAVVYVDVDDDEAKRIVLVDNRTSDLATYDPGELLELLESLPSLDGTLWPQESLDELAAELGRGPEPEEPRPRYTFGVYAREQVIDEAFAHYRSAGFPYRHAPRFECMIEINALRAAPTPALEQSNLGYRVADTYHPHRWSASVVGKRPPLETFASDKYLRVAIEHVVDLDQSFSPASFASTLSLTRNGQSVSNFRPAFTLSLLRRYAPDGGVMLDTSTGYGGRLVGFFASECDTYIGVDPSTVTHAANEKMAAELCPAGKIVELHCLPAEDVAHELVAGRCDVAFTSPPYFANEHYADEPTQSFKRYPTPDEWREGFLVPMLALQFAALKSDAPNLINIADVRVGKHDVPLVDWTLAAARELGFEIETIERYTLGSHFGRGVDDRADGGSTSEPLIVMRKP